MANLLGWVGNKKFLTTKKNLKYRGVKVSLEFSLNAHVKLMCTFHLLLEGCEGAKN